MEAKHTEAYTKLHNDKLSIAWCCLPHIIFSNKRELFEFACNLKVSRFYVGMMSGIGNKITWILRHFTVYHWKPLPCHDLSSTIVVRQLNSFLFTWKLHNKVIFSVCWHVNFCYMHAWSVSTLNKNVYCLNLPRSSVSRISPVDQLCLEI